MEKPFNFTFFGTDEFSVKTLNALNERGITPKLVITTPDKPKGRKMISTPPPAKIWAQENRIDFIQLESLKNFDLDELKAESCQLFLVASYGKIIPKNILDIPTHGTLNIHPSLLPKYRGPSPLETAILNGDPETGVTIIKLDEQMDHGPIIAQEKISLADRYYYPDLRDKLAVLGAELLVKVLSAWLAEQIEANEQNHTEATYTKKFTKEDGLLQPEDSALANYRKILAFHLWPGAYLDYPAGDQTIRLNIKKAHLEDNRLIYDRVVPAGRREMDWTSFVNGLRSSQS